MLYVPLLHTYSNTPELLTDLESVTWTVHRADLQDEQTLPSTERVWRLCDRLSEAEMDAVVPATTAEPRSLSSLANTVSTTGASTSSSGNKAVGSTRTARTTSRTHRRCSVDPPLVRNPVRDAVVPEAYRSGSLSWRGCPHTWICHLPARTPQTRRRQLHPPEPSRQPPQQLLQHRLPPGSLYPVARGHRLIVRHRHNRG
jgi:hypothetical protein